MKQYKIKLWVAFDENNHKTFNCLTKKEAQGVVKDLKELGVEAKVKKATLIIDL